MVRCRRDSFEKVRTPALPEVLKENLRVRLVPGNDVGAFQANTILTMQEVEKYLFEIGLVPIMMICEDAPRLENLPLIDTKKKYLLCTPAANGVSLITINKEDYLVLMEGRTTLTIAQMIERAKDSGVTKAKAQEIISNALEENTLYICS
jgi:hypothetical protein